MIRRPPRSTRTDNSFPTRRYSDLDIVHPVARKDQRVDVRAAVYHVVARAREDRVVARAAMHVIVAAAAIQQVVAGRSEEHTSELQSLMRISYAVFCLKKKKTTYLII